MPEGRRQDGNVSGEHGASRLVLLLCNRGPDIQAILGVLFKVGHSPSRVLSNQPVDHRLLLAVIEDQQVAALAQKSFAVISPVEYHFLRHQVSTFRAKVHPPGYVGHFAKFALDVGELKTCLAGQFKCWVQLL